MCVTLHDIRGEGQAVVLALALLRMRVVGYLFRPMKNWTLLLAIAVTFTASAFADEPKADIGPAPTEAETKAIAALGKLGVDVRPVAATYNWQTVLVRLGKEKPDAKIFAALKDMTNAQEINLADVQLADADLAQISGLKNLRVLHLEKTPVTDAGLAHLKGLTSLTYLNIYGTAVTDAGLSQLKGLTNLKSLYVFETKVTDAGIAALKEALPKLNIVKGVSAEELAKVIAKVEDKKPAAPAATPAAASKPENKAVEAEIAEAQKKLDALNAEIAKRREARAKTKQGSPEYAAADKLVQDIKSDIAKATAAVEATKAKLK
jgi:hypothetical protein